MVQISSVPRPRPSRNSWPTGDPGRLHRLRERRVVEVGGGRHAGEDRADPVRLGPAGREVARALGQERQQHRRQQQRQYAAEHQQARPAERRDDRGGGKTGRRGADGEAAEHQRDERGAALLRAELGGQRDRGGHGAAETEAGDEAKRGQGLDVGCEGGGEGGEAEEDRGGDQHRLAPDPVGERTEDEGAGHQAEEPGGEEGRELGRRGGPLRLQRRGDEADRGGVEAVDGDDEEAERDDHFLVCGQGVGVHHLLHVEDAGGHGVSSDVGLGSRLLGFGGRWVVSRSPRGAWRAGSRRSA